MNLLSRISRLEQKGSAYDPFASMTDEELSSAIAILDEHISSATGMSPKAYAEKLRTEGGEAALDPSVVAAFIASMKIDLGSTLAA